MKYLLSLFVIVTSTVSAQSINDLPGTYPYDSCQIIAGEYPGWKIADTADIRLHAPQLKGFAYLTRTRYEGNFVEVELRNPLRKLIAAPNNINDPAYYSLLLVPVAKP